MPSTEAKARKMKVNVGGKRKTDSSVSVRRSSPSVLLMSDAPFLPPSCASLKRRMKKRASFSTARRSAVRLSTPIWPIASTSSRALAASCASETNGPPPKRAKQKLRKPSRTCGVSSSIIPKS